MVISSVGSASTARPAHSRSPAERSIPDIPGTVKSHMNVRVKPGFGGGVRIGELSRRTGVSERLLRYYEEQDLLRPRRRPSGYREYDESAVVTVLHIRNLLAAGLSTATIADLLPCMGSDGERLI